MKTSWKLLMTLLVGGVLFVGCNKDDDEPDQPQVDLAFPQDYALVEGESSSIQNIVDVQVDADTEAGKTANNILWTLPSGATANLDLDATPRTLTVDFGTTNLMCNDGKERRGVIEMTWTGQYRNANTVITTVTRDYFVNDHQHRFRRVVTNEGDNAAGNPYFTVQEWDTVALAENEGTIYWQSTRNREWIEGSDTPANISDDAYSITGSSSGRSRNERAFTMNITQPLVVRVDCRYVVSGVLDLSPEGAETIRIDYGDGCAANKTARVTVRNFSADVPLRGRRN